MLTRHCDFQTIPFVGNPSTLDFLLYQLEVRIAHAKDDIPIDLICLRSPILICPRSLILFPENRLVTCPLERTRDCQVVAIPRQRSTGIKELWARLAAIAQ